MPNADLRTLNGPPASGERALLDRPAVGFALAATVPLALYLLLLNPYWVRHGDSEVMIGIARSLSRGQGFKVNGQPIGVVPPGWPMLLAATLRITTQLMALKWLSIGSLVGFCVLSYDALTHVLPRRAALVCVTLTALLQPVYFLSTVFFSDSLFSLLAMAWLCVALRIGTTRHFVPMLIALLLLGAATIAVRWAGAAWFLLVAAAIFHRAEIRMGETRRWLVTILCAVVTLASFFIVRRCMYVDPNTLDPRYALFMQGTYNLFNLKNLPMQAAQFGLWLSGLFWSPSLWNRVVKVPAEIVGTLLFVVIVIGSWRAKDRGVWAIGGAMLYTLFLAIDWPNPMSRYLIPASPLLMAGVYEGLHRWRRYHAVAVLTLSVALVNGALYVNDLRVFRSSQFYARYQGGGGASMIAAADTLKAIDDGKPIFVSSKFVNFGKGRFSDGFRRAFNFLIDRPILTDEAEFDEGLVDKLIAAHVGWYLYCPPTKQFLHADYSGPGVDTDWRLYRIGERYAQRIPLRTDREPLTRVPEW